MKFVYLEYFLLLWIIPLIILFLIWAGRNKQKAMANFAQIDLLKRLMPHYNPRLRRFKIALLLCGIFFMIFALARPRWGFKWEEISRKGIDVVIALDVSDSMLAGDVKPNRLKRAKQKIKDLLQIVTGDRIGLIAFAGVPFLQCPLTLDYGAVSIFLDHLEPGIIPVKGTAIGSALDLAIDSFDKKKNYSKAVILITDGEDHLSEPIEAAKRAKKEGITVYTIGIGKPEGAPIPSPETGGFRKDRSGNLILTKIDEPTLQKVALETGGAYVRSVTGDMDLEKIYQMEIQKKLTKGDLKSTRRKRWEERFQWFLALALFFLLVEGFLTEKPIRVRLNRNPTSSLLIFGLLSFFITPPLEAFEIPFFSRERKADQAYKAEDYEKAMQSYLDASLQKPNNQQLKYNLGDTYYRMKNYQEAAKMFSAATTGADNNIKQKAFYNLGNTLYRAGKLNESLKSYEEALKLNPNDEDTRFNYEFVKEEIKKRMQDQAKRQKQQQKQCDNPQQNNDQKDKKQQQNQDQKKKQGQQDKKQQGQKKEEEKKKKEQDQKKQKQSKDTQKKEEQQQAKPVAAKKGKKEKMSDAEAKKILNMVKEDRTKHLKKKLKKMYGEQGQPDKDW